MHECKGSELKIVSCLQEETFGSLILTSSSEQQKISRSGLCLFVRP